jgi:hypothetical protein
MMTKAMAALLVFTAGAGSPAAGELTRLERQRLIAHLEMTEKWLIDEVSGLSPAQLQFRPAPQAWNVMDVIEHLVVVGPIYWQDLQKALKSPPSTRPATRDDADTLWYGIDRTGRGKAVPAEVPKGQLHDLRAGLDTYGKLHARLVQYARTTTDDLRSHLVEREGCDAYQWLLLISTHEQRHVLQIREIKSAPGFPKK